MTNKKLKWLIGDITYIDHNHLSDETTVYFRKDGEDYYKTLDSKEFEPFIWLNSNGQNYYNRLLHDKSFKVIKNYLKKFGKKALLLKADTQFLIQSGYSYFENIVLSDLKTCILDIETTSLSPDDGEILAIGLLSKSIDGTKTYKCFSQKTSKERELLCDFIDYIKESDPDLICGHNIFSFDIPFIVSRLQHHGLPITLGKFDKELYRDYNTSKVNRIKAGFEFYQYRIPGRYIIDTMHLAIIEDTRKPEFESYNLKYLAKYLNISKEDRTYIEGGEIHNIYKTDYKAFAAYLRDDLEETEELMNRWLPAYIQMSKIIPIDLQTQIYAGPTNKFKALFCIDYYHAKEKIPEPEPIRKFEGGLSKVENSGIFTNVAKYDAKSLYPSIQLAKDVFPKSDKLGAMKKYLTQFRDERLKYKKLAEIEYSLVSKNDPNANVKKYEAYSAYQLALKILINSFYGVLGNAFFLWNDYDAAEAVTGHGRRILVYFKEEIEKVGCTIINMDTDGVYFSYPDSVDPSALLIDVNAKIDKGIELEFEKSWPKMLSYKAKNYATLDAKGKVNLTGGAFKSRKLQPFLKKFTRSFLETYLKGDPKDWDDEHFLLKRAIADKMIATEELVESSTITFDYNHYTNRTTGGKMPVFEAMANEEVTDLYKPGDKVFYYYASEMQSKNNSEMAKLYNGLDSRDYNIDHYIEILEKKYLNYKAIIN